jgi:hypothetical protein
MQGVDVWNQWRREHPNIEPDLSRADLSRGKLSKSRPGSGEFGEAWIREEMMLPISLIATLHAEAFFFGAILIRANFSRTNLNSANLKGALLSSANLGGADLYRAILSEADLSRADLSRAYLSEADLSRTDLTQAILIQTNLTAANLTNSLVYGIAAWNVELKGAIQKNLVITPEKEPTITVDNLEVAQFIYLLLNHKKLRDVLNAVTERGVLILGRFGGGGLEMLQAIAAKLREENYLPIIFDFERPQDHDYTETVKTLVGLARFVIVDLSGPSVPQELSHTVPFFDIPFVPIIEKGRNVYSLFVDLFKYPWVLRPPIEFATVKELLARMPSEVIAPAEKRHQARQKLLDELFKKA